ncbi:hypothetical protein AB0G73_25145 [Streptomyces sp. NPDC020719]|uniref:hypothetical protein n=1 Tax=Streptomyces sp. NPDC020719 TaxID=3154896 RepID=UPI00340D3868
MADERHEWLDEDAAERLLRGEPVVPADGHAREQAERLSAVLRAIARQDAAPAPAASATRELPGEAAALAAFRQARAQRGAAPTAVTADNVVRVGRGPKKSREPARGRRLRPVRFGLAAALAGCALGGVAVAAGTGVLPGLGTADPEPVSSVSPATPGPISSDSPASTGGSKPPKSPTPSRTPSGGPGSPSASASGGTEQHPSATPDPTTKGDAPGTDWAGKTVEACRDYTSGRLDQTRRHWLENAAQGAANVKRLCDRVIDEVDKGGKNGSGGKGGSGGDGDSGGKDSGGKGGSGDDKGDGHGAPGGLGGRDGSVLKLPTVSWSRPPAGAPSANPWLPVTPGGADASPSLPVEVPLIPPASRTTLAAYPTATPDTAARTADRRLDSGLDRWV